SHLTRLEVSMTRSGTLSSTLGDNLGLLIATVRFILRRTLEETERNMDTLINQLYSQLLELDLERVRLLITSDELSSYVKENFLANTRTEIKSRLKVILKDSYERYKGNINDIIKQATDRDADMSSQEFRERVNSIIDLIISMLTASISSTELAKIVLSTAKKRAHSFFKDKLNLE
ncbi:hypothetical protein, partial [Candidatus Ichthyocystis hellenicum]|uniref:hypothetical protein n=1 Tax=Candidatus Ichthyocystis hellenicum TaxID=1561003 RepID=UPI001F5FD3FE